jgi:HlyD family secretion protein
VDIKRAPPSKKKQYIAWGSGILAIVVVSLGISKLKPAAPSVERATLWVDSVRKGELLREVRAAGTLVPEHMRIIAAVTAGRIEQLPVRPGVTVSPGTILVEMSNTDVQLQALQAEQSLTQARSGLASLKQSGLASLKQSLLQQRLAQEGAVASAKTMMETALRRLKEMEALDEKKLASPNEVAAARDAALELKTRYDLEVQRLSEMNSSAKEQIVLNEEQVNRLSSIVREQMNRVNSMRVVAGETGVLQSLGPNGVQLELGQWVNPGMELARVAQPGRLKAVIRVPETQARDIAVGQKASVDTRNGIVAGHVMRIDPGSSQGTVTVEIAISGELPRGARADMSVDGTIEIERLPNAMFVGRPAYGSAESTVGLFKISEDGSEATLVTVRLGRTSVSFVEVLNGLAVGDSVIISDMSQWDNQNRIRLKR